MRLGGRPGRTPASSSASPTEGGPRLRQRRPVGAKVLGPLQIAAPAADAMAAVVLLRVFVLRPRATAVQPFAEQAALLPERDAGTGLGDLAADDRVVGLRPRIGLRRLV